MTTSTVADDLQAHLRESCAPDALRWLDDGLRRVASDPAAMATLFPAVGRQLGRGRLDTADALRGWTVDDAGRALLLLARGPAADTEVEALYRHGDRAERRGVLRALALLPIGDAGVPLVQDALRSNDVELIAAAMGPYARAHLDDDAWAHAVLKCVFVGIPLSQLPGAAKRSTPRLARMLAGYVHERIAAGRDVPAEVWPLIERHPPEPELAAIRGELDHPDAQRRRAAEAALATRPAA